MENYREFIKAHLWREFANFDTDQKKNLPPPPMQKPVPEGATLVDLVAAEDLTVGQMPLIEAIRRRRSCRHYSQEPLTLEELSFLLWATQGVSKTDGGQPLYRGVSALRTVPSGGARHPFETYLLVQRVIDVLPGLYRYLPLEHKLCLLQPYAQLAQMLAARWGTQGFIIQGAVLFIWTVLPYRTEWRYADVSAKLIAQDSGHLCQNLYLASEAIGAGACAVGAYDQQLADELLGVDGENEFVVYMAPVGKRP